ncbi:MAG: O-antigen ligase family protein [Chthoniobacterales bacterium]
MGDGPPQRRRRTHRAESGGAWKDAALALLPVLACFLGGATEKWAEGVVVALLGLLLLVRPPRVSLGVGFNAVIVGLVALAATAFLPARWFFIPPWRDALVNDFAIKLPATFSPQPWITVSCLINLVAGVAWLYLVAAQELDSRDVRRQLRMFAGGVIALAALSLALYLAKSALPFWHNQRGFGPFPNRNQTADLLGITAVVIMACGQDDIRHGNKRWIFWALGLALIIAAIVLNFSRAGIAILVAGSALWLGAMALRSGSAGRIAIGFSALLALLTVMLLFGGQTLERFHLRVGDSSGGVTSDFRWLIFHDAIALIRASPWCGIGLGNFQPVFAIFREASLNQNRVLHPESDWFWVAAELGWPAVILVLAGGILLVRRVFPLSEGTNMRLRVAALVGALLFAFHGFVDVSAHRVGSSYAGLLLLGLALHRGRDLRRSVSITVIARIVGLLLVAAGATWIFASARALPLPGGIGADLQRSLAAAANKERNFNAIVAHTSRGLEWAPLDWQLYFLRAIGEVGASHPTEAMDDFRRARFLEPGSYELPYQEGLTWITRDPVLTMTAWREALRRAGSERPELYARMLSSAAQLSPAVNQILQDFGAKQPDLALTFLERVSGENFTRAVTRLLEHDPSLHTLTNDQKTRLFASWSERGDLRQLSTFADNNDDLLKFAWRGVAKQRANEKDFRGAVDLARRFSTPPKLPPVPPNESTEQLQQRVFASANNYEAGLALYQKQMQEGRTDDALITVRRFTDQPNAPAYFHFLEANAWSAKGDWERAWNAWRVYLRD